MKFKVGDKIKCVLETCGCDGSEAIVTGITDSHYYIKEGDIEERYYINTMEEHWELVKEYNAYRMEQLSNNKEIKCECGSESCGSSAHSSWCPKF